MLKKNKITVWKAHELISEEKQSPVARLSINEGI